VLNEIFRVLVPGGLLLLTAPLGSGIHQEPYHFYGGYTPWFYEKYLAETGFDEILVLANGGFYKHYSQETLRFIKSTQPWRTEVGFVFKVVWFPFWLLLLPVMLLVAVVSFFLDPIDQEKRFTVGYFVRAEKKQTGTLRE
jgi:SAM-dependent methyltransferase